MPASWAVPEGAHVREVLVEAARPGERLVARPGVGGAEAVGDHDVVVVDGVVRGDRVGRGVERDELGRGQRVGGHRVGGGVGDADAAVDGDVGVAAQDDPVGELGDGDGGTLGRERGHLRGQVAVGVGPGGALPVVDAEPVLLEEPVGAVLDDEGAAETRDHAVVVAQPPDGRGGAVRAGEGLRVDVEDAAVGRARPGGRGGRSRCRAGGRSRRRAGGRRACRGHQAGAHEGGQGGEDAEADEVGPPGEDPGAV